MPIYYLSLFHFRPKWLFLWTRFLEIFFGKVLKWMGYAQYLLEANQLPQLMRGLGIGNLKYQNEALLAKWIRRFLREENALWWQLIVGEVYLWGANFLWSSPILRGFPKSPWRYISSTIALIDTRIQERVGNELHTVFWDDLWLNGEKLVPAFPRLYRLSTK